MGLSDGFRRLKILSDRSRAAAAAGLVRPCAAELTLQTARRFPIKLPNALPQLRPTCLTRSHEIRTTRGREVEKEADRRSRSCALRVASRSRGQEQARSRSSSHLATSSRSPQGQQRKSASEPLGGVQKISARAAFSCPTPTIYKTYP